MNERKKYQHYVPRFYLEGFQDDSGKLWCYDKQLDKAYQGSPDSLGGEKFFYDVPEVEKQLGVSQFIENWFNPLETDAATTLKAWRKSLLTTGEFSPTESERHIMATYLAVQYLRTPRGRQKAEELTLLAAKISFFNYLGEKDPEIANQIQNPIEEIQLSLAKDRRPAAHATILLNIPLIEELATILLKHIWIVVENKTESSYYTSDHPVVVVPHAGTSVRPKSGLASTGIQVIYPLTPQYSLSLLERNFWKLFAPSDRKVHRLQIAKASVEFDNSVQVVQSSRFVYSQDSDFTLVKDMCRENPELKNPQRTILHSR